MSFESTNILIPLVSISIFLLYTLYQWFKGLKVNKESFSMNKGFSTGVALSALMCLGMLYFRELNPFFMFEDLFK